MDNKKIGDYISTLRKSKNLTQKDLADLLGVTDKAVSKWERGAGYPDISILRPLADILGTTVDELLVGQEAKDTSATSGDAMVKALDYADKLVASRENKLGKMISAILAGCLILAICASVIVNVAVSHELTWSLLVIDGCILAAALLLPLLLVRERGLVYSLGFLTVLILPFLGVIEYTISGSLSSEGWLRRLGMPIALTWLVILWFMYILYKKSHMDIWLYCSIGLLLCVPGQLITNYTADVFTNFAGDPADRYINYTINTISMLAAAALCFTIGIYRRKRNKPNL